MSNSNSFGKALYSALRDRKSIGPLSEQDSTLTVDDAYAISLEFLALRQKDGERVIGKKIGVTSKAVQDMLGVHQPDFGFLTDWMQMCIRDRIQTAQPAEARPTAMSRPRPRVPPVTIAVLPERLSLIHI